MINTVAEPVKSPEPPIEPAKLLRIPVKTPHARSERPARTDPSNMEQQPTEQTQKLSFAKRRRLRRLQKEEKNKK